MPFAICVFARAEHAVQGKDFAADEVRGPVFPEGLGGLHAI